MVPQIKGDPLHVQHGLSQTPCYCTKVPVSLKPRSGADSVGVLLWAINLVWADGQRRGHVHIGAQKAVRGLRCFASYIYTVKSQGARRVPGRARKNDGLPDIPWRISEARSMGTWWLAWRDVSVQYPWKLSQRAQSLQILEPLQA